jgi:hypothetical protein
LHKDNLLLEDRDVVAASLSSSQKSEDTFGYISSQAQVMYPDLVAATIRNCAATDICNILEDIEPSLWQDARVVYAWLARGGPYLDEHFLREMKRDEQAFLLIAEHNPKDFWSAAEELSTRKDYLD